MRKTCVVILAVSLLALLLVAGCGEKAGQAIRMARNPSRQSQPQVAVQPAVVNPQGIASVQCQIRSAKVCEGNMSVTINIAADCSESRFSNPCQYGCLNGVCNQVPVQSAVQNVSSQVIAAASLVAPNASNSSNKTGFVAAFAVNGSALNRSLRT
jgi:hypothetical protein